MSDCFGDCEQRELKNKILRLEAEIAELEDCEQQWGEKWVSERKENERLREALDTELVCCHIGTLDQQESPKHAIAAIARWHYDLGVSRVLEENNDE